jgi:hypothetical protein
MQRRRTVWGISEWRDSGLYVATPPALIAVDLHLIFRLSLSHEFDLSRCCDGGRVTIGLAKSACASQDSLWLAILEELTDVDCGHYGPLSPFRFFYVKAFKQTREGGREIVELNVCKQHPMEEDEKFQRAGIGSRPLCLRTL